MILQFLERKKKSKCKERKKIIILKNVSIKEKKITNLNKLHFTFELICR